MPFNTILTIWLLIQLFMQLYRNVKMCRLENKNDSVMLGGQFGIISKFIGMFACLYYGGFYG